MLLVHRRMRRVNRGLNAAQVTVHWHHVFEYDFLRKLQGMAHYWNSITTDESSFFMRWLVDVWYDKALQPP